MTGIFYLTVLTSVHFIDETMHFNVFHNSFN